MHLSLTLPNVLSFVRVPLALLFLVESPMLRALAIGLAMSTDILDGFIARRYRQASSFGAVLDPLMDKLFVFFALAILFHEERLTLIEALCMLCRDFAVIFFGIYLLWSKRWKTYRFQSIWCGKITTSLQFLVLLGLTFQVAIPSAFYAVFILLGFLALGELYLSHHRRSVS